MSQPFHHVLPLALLTATLAAAPAPSAAQSLTGSRSHAYTIALSVPAFAGPVWIYLDNQLVASAPSDNRWSIVKTPVGYKIYLAKAGLVATYENGTENIFQDTVKGILFTGMNDPDTAAREHLFPRFTLKATPGNHSIDILYYQPRASTSRLPFPFHIAHFGIPYDPTGGSSIELGSPAFLPPDWENPDIPNIVPGSISSVCPDGNAPPDIAQVQSEIDTYLHNPVVEALHSAPPPTTIGNHRVLLLALPPELGGTRPFDATELHFIVAAVRQSLGERLTRYKDISLTPEGSLIGRPCTTRFPNFASSYLAAIKVTDHIYDDMNALDTLIP